MSWQKEVLAKNLRYYMSISGNTQKEMAEIAGVSAPTFHDWINAKKYPRIDKIERLAHYFGILKPDLIEEKRSYSTPKKKGVKIPVLGEVAAGVPLDAIEDVIDYEEIREDMAKTGDFFGLKIKGDSMSPRMLDGDVVIVRKQNDVESGDIAIVLVNGDSATCKKLVKHDNGVTLIANNPAVYEPHFYTMQEVDALPVKVIGKVVELRGKF